MIEKTINRDPEGDLRDTARALSKTQKKKQAKSQMDHKQPENKSEETRGSRRQEDAGTEEDDTTLGSWMA